MLARSLSHSKILLAPLLVCLPLLASACVFGGDSEDPVAPTPTVPVAPAIGRSGPTPTETPFGGATPRPTLPPPPIAATPAPDPARSTVEGLISVVYSFPFVWPADGPITSFMSPEHPNGIDIGLNGSDALQIRAAAGGTVISAGGSDDEPLGLSIEIDHGNGVTTVYGHLSELGVSEGDQVEIGQVIGIGGSTGESTGNHLHLEVRKDGETVDPLHVLPSEDRDTTAIEVDCATTPFTLPSGSLALINFQSILADGEEVVSVDAVPLNDGPALQLDVQNETEVRVGSAIDFSGPNGLDSYDLEVTVDSAAENKVLNCGFVVQRRDVPTTFYVRAAPPASDIEGDEGDEGDASDGEATDGETAAATTPEPTPTATPNPWAGTPNYQVPAGSGNSSGGGSSSGVQTPSYGVPSGAQTPSYGIPFGSPTPAP